MELEKLYAGRQCGLNVTVVRANIVDLAQEVECMAVSGNGEGAMGGGVSKAVNSAVVEDLEHLARRRRPAVGTAFLLNATMNDPNSRLKWVAYCAILKRPADPGNQDDLRSATRALLQAAHRASVHSIALPLMGSGVGLIHEDASARILVEALREHALQYPDSPLRAVFLVGFTFGQAHAFASACSRHYRQSLKKSAVVVIDMIEEFVGENGLISREQALAITPGINRLASSARALGLPVIFSSDHHARLDNELQYTKRHALTEPKLLSSLDLDAVDVSLEKTAYSAFIGSELEDVLRRTGSETVLLVGTQTHVCVKYSALHAAFAGFRAVVVSDLVDSNVRSRHDAGLREVAQYFGEVIRSDVLMSLLRVT